MKSSDFIIDFFVKKGVKHFFGYQGTMIAHLVDSIDKNEDAENHSCYHEQGGALAAVGYAKASGKCSVAYATSGPGAINLMQGVADAFYDSVPVIFITGQLNTTEYTDIIGLRQQGFQETNIIEMASTISKSAIQVKSIADLPSILEKAWLIANGEEKIGGARKGPVVIDLPMNMQRQEIEFFKNSPFKKRVTIIDTNNYKEIASEINNLFKQAKRPIFLLGNGIAKSNVMKQNIRALVEKYKVPTISSMLGIDFLPTQNQYNYGYIGSGYGQRAANIIAYAKCDLIISLGCRMCTRQIGFKVENFAKNSRIVRVDIDARELERKIHENDIVYNVDVNKLIPELLLQKPTKAFDEWNNVCKKIRKATYEFDTVCEERFPNKLLENFSKSLNEDAIITCDVGQHQVWTAQSFIIKDKTKIIFSGSHGTMGFALPAAIGAYYATGNRTICICGAGSLQMNIQELQWLVRENLPILLVVLNNNSLGLVVQQQDDYLNSNYCGTVQEKGYSSPEFVKIANAYGIKGKKLTIANLTDTEFADFLLKAGTESPFLLEIELPPKTKAYPKTFFGEEMYDQRPNIDKETMQYLLSL